MTVSRFAAERRTRGWFSQSTIDVGRRRHPQPRHWPPRTFLIRLVGPTLEGAPFNVPGTMADPKLEIFPAGSDTPIHTQDNWSDDFDAATTAQVASSLGAFALTDGSADAAFVVTLQPGTYTVVGSSAIVDGTGVIQVEVYVVP